MERAVRDLPSPALREKALATLQHVRILLKHLDGLAAPDEATREMAYLALERLGDEASRILELEVAYPRTPGLQASALTALARRMECNREDARIYAVLEQLVVDVDVEDVSFEGFVKELEEKSGVRFRIDPDSPAQEKISIRVVEMRLNGILTLALRPRGWVHSIREGAVLVKKR